MPMPMATQPNPAANPAAVPKAMLVVGALRNIARLIDMMSVRRKLMPKTLPILVAGGVSPKPLARCQALPKTAGEYQRPPRTKAEMVATRMAQMLRVCMFRGCAACGRVGKLFAGFCRGWAKLFLPVERTFDEAAVQRRQQLRIAGGEVLIGAVPLRAIVPAGLGEADDGVVTARFEVEGGAGAGSADGRKFVGCEGGDDDLLLGDEAQDGAASGAAREVDKPVSAGAKVDRRVRSEPGAETLAGGESLPDFGSRSRDGELDDQRSLGLLRNGRQDGGCEGDKGGCKAKGFHRTPVTWLVVQVNTEYGDCVNIFPRCGVKNYGEG